MAETIIKAEENPTVVSKSQEKRVEVMKNKDYILKNTAGKEVDAKEYFFGNGIPPARFNESCGLPVEREDLVEIFNKVFDPKHDFLFYKTTDKELYIIIVPLKYSSSVGAENESVNGDFQKHAISFISEGSVNHDTLKAKLKRILPFVKFGN
jgi:hypothetical protein